MSPRRAHRIFSTTRHSRLWLALVGLTCPASAAGRTLGLNPSAGTNTCDTVALAADAMSCDRQACQLRGQVHLTCGAVRLWADEVDIALDEHQGFAGAEARGHVLVVEADTVLTCNRFLLGPDRIQGRILTATFRVKTDARTKDERGVPSGRDRLVLHGDLERTDATHIRVDQADLTLCDCGDAPPSWRLSADRIEMTVNERAWLWWPQLWLNPFGLGLVPASPPLLPISVALRDRALGLLAPEIKFANPPWPILDLPVFVPLGDSWDLTLKPGMRFDWGTHHLTPVSSWGAPRLGGRLRWAPRLATQGEMRVQWTFDRKRFAAGQLRRDDAQNPPAERLPAAFLDAREALVHRLDLTLDQRTDLNDDLRWLLAAEWVSDDLVPADFRVSLDDRVANYIPSRTELLWRRPALVGELAADYLLVLDNAYRLSQGRDATGNPIDVDTWDFSNIRGREAGVTHRGPWLRLRTLPLALGDALYGEAEASLVRYGPWTATRPPDQVLGGGKLALAFRDAWRGAELEANATLDLLWIDPTMPAAELSGLLQLDLAASTRLGRRFGSVLHVVEPGLRWRNIPWLTSTRSTLSALDTRLDRRQVHQVALSLTQSLWRLPGAPTRLANLTIIEPLGLNELALLPTRVDADAVLFDRTRLGGWIDVDLESGLSPEEVGGSISSWWGPLSGGTSYSRWTPQAERFRRNQYELAAAGARLEDSAALHVARANLAVRLGERLQTAYDTAYLLPIPGGAAERQVGFAFHRLLVGYRSPCDCWEIQALVHVPTRDPLANLRAEIKLAIGGYAIGN